MSVFIKGMKMPECCYECPLRDEYDDEYSFCIHKGRRLDATLHELKKYRWKDPECPLAELNEVDRELGEWIEDGDFIDCSVCHKEKWSRGEPFESIVKGFRYCPNCGAKMNVKRRFEV